MKTRFNTVDIRVAVSELRERYLGMRVANVYDIDNKTYIIKLAKPDEKVMILLESGNKIHSSQFDWPKNMFPSGFSMKLRKHLRTRRLESIEQLGVDRIVDLQFGSSEAAYHVILELYDRGNIVLTDHEYNILNILRPRADDSQDVRFAVNEKYPLELAKQKEPLMTMERLQAIIGAAKQGDNIKRLLIPHVCYGPPLIEHCLIGAGFSPNVSIGKGFNIEDDLPKLMSALIEAEEIFNSLDKCKGYIIQKREKKPKAKEGEDQELLTYEDFCPLHFRQHQNLPFIEVDTFNKAIDEFFSKHESQKFDMQALQQEKSALKKLENVKKDHEKRLTQLQNEQEEDKKKAQMIEMNLTLVDRAILVVQSALANQIDWTEIQAIVKEAQLQGDPVASAIKGLKLDINHITMLLGFPYSGLDSDDEDEMKPMKVDIDLSISAYGNARRYFDMKRTAAKKEQKTVDASSKALKSAERKTKETLKEVATKVSIQKLRKVHWFEKFLWFISSENFLVIAGRDQQQNEMIYKRYLRPGDIYVHADLHGASSLVIKNHTKDPVPPKTLNEAGTMATCNSAAWDAKVVTSAWWVYHNQVSKTAPTGEYLTTGSFMVRGKKNYLPPSHLVYGFGVLFKVDDTSVFRHKGERQVRMAEEDKMSVTDSLASESEASESVDLDISDSDSDSETASVCSKSNNDPFGENTENRTKDETADDAIANIMKDEPGLSTSVDGLVLQDVEEVKGVADKPDGAEHEVDSVQVNEEESEAQQKVVNAGSSVDNENVDEKSEFLFPDTTISLAHVGGDKYGLQRALSSSSYEEPEPEEKNEIHIQSKDRLTAKQRRELKKKKKTNPSTDDQTPASIQQDSQQAASKGIAAVPKEKVEKQPTQQQAKRGQKAKMKKIKEKYGDQDEDERTLKMEILASAGPQKEDKKKKGKKEKAQQQQQQQKQKQMMLQKKKAAMAPLGKEGVILSEDSVIRSGEGKEIVPKESHKVEDDGNLSDEEKQAVLEDENVTLVEDADVFDSLTGIPNPEDELLYAIPYSAPYSMLLNFKYKVKLTPGSTKRGKAAKTALHMFMFDRTATQREKDLLKSIKDSDMARNLPGKVKVSAPNLQKAKGKK